MTTSQQRIYEYLIQNGNTNAANTMNMAKLGLWAAGQNINTGNKLSTFIKRFPQVFALMDDNKLIYAIPLNDDDGYDITQEDGSLLATNPPVPYSWNRDDFQSPTFNPKYPKDVNVPLYQKKGGGKSKSKSRSASKSKSRSARKSRTARKSRRKSRSRKNRNRRNKTDRN